MAWLRRNVEVLAFLLGLTLLVFLAGMGVGRAGLFPWPIVNRAVDAVNDLRENWKHYLGIRSKYESLSDRTEGGVRVHDPALASPGFTMVAAYRSDRPGRYDVYLLDMEGRVAHEWDADFRRIWPNPTHIDARGWEGNVEVHGAYLYGNGDLLIDLGGPGSAKLDRCGNVLWTSELYTHHSIEPAPDGGAITPSKIRRSEPEPGQTYFAPGPSGFYDDDTVALLDEDGRTLHEESVIDILYRSGWQSVLFSRPTSTRRIAEDDPIHLNDAEVLTPELAPAFPMFRAGDIILSVRHTNTLFVVDPKTWTAKWVMTGPFIGQHDPDFLPDGTILVYDNRITGGDPRFGNTRLLKVDPRTKEVVWAYEGEGDQAFYARSRGEQQVLPNGNILIADPHHGRVFEIAPSAGNRTVWEWHNVTVPNLSGLVTDVQRIPTADAAAWVGQPCGGSP